MTKPIAEGAERKRPARSCLACRTAKIKCSGAVLNTRDVNVADVASKKCNRCDRLGIPECVFAQSRRKGRPRRIANEGAPRRAAKKKKREESSDEEEVDENAGLRSSLTPDEERKPTVTPAGAPTPLSIRQDSISPVPIPLPPLDISPSTSTTSLPIVNDPANHYAVAEEIDGDYQSFLSQALAHGNVDTRYSPEAQQQYYEQRPQQPSPEQYATSINSSAYSLPYYDDGSSYSSRYATSPGTSPPDCRPLRAPNFASDDVIDLVVNGYIHNVQAFLPLLPTDPPTLKAYLRVGPPCLLFALSAVAFPSAPKPLGVIPRQFPGTIQGFQAAVFAFHSLYGKLEIDAAREVLVWLGSEFIARDWHHLDRLGNVSSLSPEDKEAIRKMFWEIWAIEVIFAVATGVRQFILHRVNVEVQTLDDAELLKHGSPYSLKIQALSLLRNATDPPPFVPGRFEQLQTRSQELASVANRSYHSLMYHESRPAAREAAFMAALLASASTIFLSCPTYASRGFMCGLDTTVEPATLGGVREACATLLSTVSTSLAPFVTPTPHAPFFGCSLFVGCQGLIMSMTKLGPSDPFLAANLVAELDVLEYALEQQKKRWEVAAVVLNEVRTLRFITAPSMSATVQGGWLKMIEPSAM